MATQGCKLLILDEIFGCLSCGLITEEQLLNLIKNKTCELVLTGRHAPKSIIAVADYVSELLSVKHPYEQDVTARKGIEF